MQLHERALYVTLAQSLMVSRQVAALNVGQGIGIRAISFGLLLPQYNLTRYAKIHILQMYSKIFPTPGITLRLSAWGRQVCHWLFYGEFLILVTLALISQIKRLVSGARENRGLCRKSNVLDTLVVGHK
jgi:hypothetical protein